MPSVPKQGGLPPLPGNPVYPKWRGLRFLFLFFSLNAHQRGNSQPALLFRDVMAAVRASCTSSLLGRYHPAGIPLLPDSNHSCSHDVTAHPTQASRFEGFPTRAHVLCSSELYTHARLENPSVPNSLSSLASVRPRDQLTSTVYVSGPDFTRAGAHAAALCEARHEPRARCCANPARSSKWLWPLLGLCLLSGAVSIAI